MHDTLGFHMLLGPWVGKGGIGPRMAQQVPTVMANRHRFQHRSPILGAMHAALAQQRPLHIAIPIAEKQRVAAGAPKTSVMGSAFLRAICLADLNCPGPGSVPASAGMSQALAS